RSKIQFNFPFAASFFSVLYTSNKSNTLFAFENASTNSGLAFDPLTNNILPVTVYLFKNSFALVRALYVLGMKSAVRPYCIKARFVFSPTTAICMFFTVADVFILLKKQCTPVALANITHSYE